MWCDALSNYITAVCYEKEDDLFKKVWPCDVHLIGKDILRFHAGIWIGMLFSAGVKLPKAVYVHGFVTSEGQKMSKTTGNVVDPLAYVEKYGVDALRYYLLREIPTMDDGDFSHTRFVDLYNSELANSLGNLVNRVVMMTERYVGGKVPAMSDGGGVKNVVEDIFARYGGAFSAFDLKAVCECIVELVDFSNKYIDDKKPWAMAASGDAGLNGVLYDLLELLRFICILLLPILPQASLKIAEQIGLKGGDIKFGGEWGILKEGGPVKKMEGTLFPRIEESA